MTGLKTKEAFDMLGNKLEDNFEIRIHFLGRPHPSLTRAI